MGNGAETVQQVIIRELPVQQVELRHAAVKREKDTLWKLVDAQCVQLASAISGSRAPFLLALIWAFIWG